MSDDQVPFKEKIKSVGFVNKQGTKRSRPVVNEDTGKVVGKHVDHWDGRVDAVATAPQTVAHKAKGKVYE